MKHKADLPGEDNLYRSSRFSVMGPLHGGPQGPLRGAVKPLLALIAIWLVLAFDYPVGTPSATEFDHSANGVWIAARWSNALVPPEESISLAQRLGSQGIEWIYADEGTLSSDGRLPRENFLYAGGVVEYIHKGPGRMKVLAWISGRVGGANGLALSDPATRARIIDTCKYLVSQLDFDGVQLDIEPLPSGNRDFLALLEELRAGIGSKTISVAAMKWTPFAPTIGSTSLLPYSWDESYYQEVATRCDQLVVMTYDSGVPFANLYIKYVGWQTSHVLESLEDVPTCRVLIGVPSYDEHSFWHQDSENIGAGLQGVVEALADFRRIGYVPTDFEGVAIYGEWDTSQQDWAVYDKVWYTGK